MIKTGSGLAMLIAVLIGLAACSGAREGPAAQPSTTDVNPITGSRGGSGAR